MAYADKNSFVGLVDETFFSLMLALFQKAVLFSPGIILIFYIYSIFALFEKKIFLSLVFLTSLSLFISLLSHSEMQSFFHFTSIDYSVCRIFSTSFFHFIDR